MMTVTIEEALKIVNSYALETEEEAKTFVRVHSSSMDNKTLDEMIASYETTLTWAANEVTPELAASLEMQIDKFRKCKKLLTA